MITKAESKAIDELINTVVETRNAQQPSNPILGALDLLHIAYPSERVDIWASRVGDNPIRFTAMVEATTLPAEPVYEVWAESPMDAAEKLIAKAGSRNPSDRIRKRLAELQQEMDKLQAEAKEVA